MIWSKFGGSFRCSKCCYMPHSYYKITEVKACPNCGEPASFYEKAMFDADDGYRFTGYKLIPMPDEERKHDEYEHTRLFRGLLNRNADNNAVRM